MNDAPGSELREQHLTEALGAQLWAEAREEGEVHVVLGPRERALLDEMPWPLRRSEWLAGRRAAKALLERAFGFEPHRVEVLPLESGAPVIYLDGVVYPGLVLNISHTRRWAVAAAGQGRVGVDACDHADGPRLERIGTRVFSEGEAEACGAHRSAAHQAAVWALKEAGLKLRIGGVFDPGARSIRVVSLDPARVADVTMSVTLLRLRDAAVAVARDACAELVAVPRESC